LQSAFWQWQFLAPALLSEHFVKEATYMYDNKNRALAAISGRQEICLIPGMANRHGLITGATGTGKTVTLQTLAETFSSMGVPVFAADMKGDLSGVAAPGGNKESVQKRVSDYGLQDKGFRFQAFPVQFWDLFGEQGAPVRATIADMGPLLLSRLLALNETQAGVLALVFKLAGDERLELVDLKDLRSCLEYAAANAAKYGIKYGNISAASIGAIQRNLLALEQQGGGAFFGEPALKIKDLLRTEQGKGVINILAADRIMNSPKLYTSFLLWLLSRLFDTLPETGDPEKPVLVFFFDEAHLLFKDAPKALLEKVEQVVRLIRSKGVGIFFISQVPSDIPDTILGQLGNRVQHALRAYTPKDQKALKAAAQSFRSNPAFDTEQAISELVTGECLVSFLNAAGAPAPVERAFMLPPEGQIGPLDQNTRRNMLQNSLLFRYYAESKDRASAHEKLAPGLEKEARAKEEAARSKSASVAEKAEARERKEQEKAAEAQKKREERKAEQTKKFWSSLFKAVITPIIRKFILGLFKR
jgi:DNA helicase HerA-like ATPase